MMGFLTIAYTVEDGQDFFFFEWRLYLIFLYTLFDNSKVFSLAYTVRINEQHTWRKYNLANNFIMRKQTGVISEARNPSCKITLIFL